MKTKNRQKRPFYFVYVIFFLIIISCKQATTSNEVDLKIVESNKNFLAVYPLALRGEMTEVFKILDTINTIKLNDKEKEKKEQFYTRFKTNEESYDYKTSDPTIIEYVSQFQNYWKTVMLSKVTSKNADSIFRLTMTNFLYDKHYHKKNIAKDSIEVDLYKYSNQFLEDHGFYSNAFGKTAHLYDLFLWKTEEVKVYPIALINDSVNVHVYFMKDFISQGWAHYSTLGRNYASGWANREALYAVDDAYDRSTEDFKVSYLAHEGQHFADYKTFPNLQQKDLEYRAKLLELAKSEDTTFKIIGSFINNAKNDSNNAHSFANYCVIRDLSKELFDEAYITSKEKWTSISKSLIKEKSIKLFNKHTASLHKIGSDKGIKL